MIVAVDLIMKNISCIVMHCLMDSYLASGEAWIILSFGIGLRLRNLKDFGVESIILKHMKHLISSLNLSMGM